MFHKLRRLLPLATLLACTVGAAAVELAPGVPAPPLQLELLDGGTFDTTSQRGKVIVLNFWATWCAPCREEMPAIDAFYRAHRAQGLEVLAINIDAPRDMAKVRRVMKDFSLPVALASGNQIAGYGRFARVPITFVVDRNGLLQFDGTKSTKLLDRPTLEKIVSPLLRSPKDATLVATSPVAGSSVVTP